MARALHFSKRMRARKVIVAIGLVLGWNLTAVAAEVRLFESDGKAVARYESEIASIQPGDTLDFGNGRKFIVHKKLGEGSHTVVFALQDREGRPTGKAIRVSRYAGRHPVLRNTTHADLLEGFARASGLVEELGAQSVKVYREESEPRRFVVVEALDIVFTYRQFLSRKFQNELPEPVRNRAMDDFVPFARSVALFRNLGDQSPDQIGYVKGRGWVLFDYTEAGTARASTVGEASPFRVDFSMQMAAHGAVMEGNMLGGGDERLPTPRGLGSRVDRVVTERRLEAGLPEGFCRRAFKTLGRWLGGRF